MIDKEKVKHLALLARLTLNDEEIEALTKDLNNILNYVEKINELNLEGLEPLYNLLEELPLREDKIFESENRSDIIKNFPEKDNNYLKVPKIL
ncbi:MAG: Asp-tRNA(Asn)/Glu-tRNA(Gln) amidotransferase GatCAB subunit C [Patescibacteria group bacterium]